MSSIEESIERFRAARDYLLANADDYEAVRVGLE
jgi:hypothetical protein